MGITAVFGFYDCQRRDIISIAEKDCNEENREFDFVLILGRFRYNKCRLEKQGGSYYEGIRVDRKNLFGCLTPF